MCFDNKNFRTLSENMPKISMKLNINQSSNGQTSFPFSDLKTKLSNNHTCNLGKPGGLDGRDQSRLIETLSRSSRLTFENRRDFLDGRD
jgi:hypothetical protein